MTLRSALTAIVRAFVSTADERDEFVALNRCVLSELAPAEKREIWELMKVLS